MSAFLAAAFSLPTVVFTVLLLFFLGYALLTLLGAADIEWLDSLFGLDEAEEALEGADGEGGPLHGALSGLGVVEIPLAIFGGVATVFAWLASFAAMQFLPGNALVKIGVGLGAALLGLRLGSWAVRPLRRVFATPAAPVRSEIVGKICTIRSLHVNERAGTAEVEDGGAGIIAEVRCLRENQLTRGSKAVVYDYDQKEGIYRVGPIEHSVDVDIA